MGSLHESERLRLRLADAELTDGTRLDHYVIRLPINVVSLVVSDAASNESSGCRSHASENSSATVKRTACR